MNTGCRFCETKATLFAKQTLFIDWSDAKSPLKPLFFPAPFKGSALRTIIIDGTSLEQINSVTERSRSDQQCGLLYKAVTSFREVKTSWFAEPTYYVD